MIWFGAKILAIVQAQVRGKAENWHEARGNSYLSLARSLGVAAFLFTG